MIQRVQSLLLLGAVIMGILMFYIPVYESVSANPLEPGTPVTISISKILIILNSTIAAFCLLNIFLYKNRNIQIRICNLAMLLSCAFIFLLFFLADTMTSGGQKVHYLYGSYVPLIELLLIFIAMRFVKHDEALVRSADRLR